MSIKNQVKVVHDLTAVAKRGERMVTLSVGSFDSPPSIETVAEIESRAIEAFRWTFEDEPTHTRAVKSQRTVDA